jgi:hypothetical protein
LPRAAASRMVRADRHEACGAEAERPARAATYAAAEQRHSAGRPPTGASGSPYCEQETPRRTTIPITNDSERRPTRKWPASAQERSPPTGPGRPANVPATNTTSEQAQLRRRCRSKHQTGYRRRSSRDVRRYRSASMPKPSSKPSRRYEASDHATRTTDPAGARAGLVQRARHDRRFRAGERARPGHDRGGFSELRPMGVFPLPVGDRPQPTAPHADRPAAAVRPSGNQPNNPMAATTLK